MNSDRPVPHADGAAETLGQLVGRFVHDLGNHLGVTLSTVELAAKIADTDQQRQLLAQAVDSIRTQRALLDRMAAASLSSQRPERCDVHALLRAAITRRGATGLAIQAAASDAIVHCDPAFLARSIEHLVAFGQAVGATTLATTNAPATRYRNADDSLVLSLFPIAEPDEATRAFKPFAADGSCALAQIHDTARRAGGFAVFASDADGRHVLRVVLRLAAHAQALPAA